jgi:hypothetical protein
MQLEARQEAKVKWSIWRWHGERKSSEVHLRPGPERRLAIGVLTPFFLSHFTLPAEANFQRL